MDNLTSTTSQRPTSKKMKNHFIVAVYDFLFGPPRVETDAEVHFIFSLLFFAIPVSRYFYLQSLIKQRNIDNVRKRIWKVFYLDTKPIISSETIEKIALTTPNGKKTMEAEALKKYYKKKCTIGTSSYILTKMVQQIMIFRR